MGFMDGNYALQNNPLRNINSAQDAQNYGWWSKLTGAAQDKSLEANFNAEQAAIERDFNANEAEKARNFNAEQAQLARDFEERMSNTAYQRAMADAQKAGINILNATNQQASTPTGAAAQGAPANSGRAAIATAGSNGAGSFITGALKMILGTALGNAAITARGAMQTIKVINDGSSDKLINKIIDQNFAKKYGRIYNDIQHGR